MNQSMPVAAAQSLPPSRFHLAEQICNREPASAKDLIGRLTDSQARECLGYELATARRPDMIIMLLARCIESMMAAGEVPVVLPHSQLLTIINALTLSLAYMRGQFQGLPREEMETALNKSIDAIRPLL